MTDTLIRTHLKLHPHFEFANADLTSITYLRYYLLSGGESDFSKSKLFRKMTIEGILGFMEANL